MLWRPFWSKSPQNWILFTILSPPWGQPCWLRTPWGWAQVSAMVAEGKTPLLLSLHLPHFLSFANKPPSFHPYNSFSKELLCDPQKTRNMGDLLHLHTAKIPVFPSGFRTKCDRRRYSLGNRMPHEEKMEWHSSQKGDIFIILCSWETSQKRLSGDIQPWWPVLFIYLFSLSWSSFLESSHCWKYLEPLLTPGLPFQQAPVLFLLLTFLSTSWSPSACHTARGHIGC